jgi:hypothetical protein
MNMPGFTAESSVHKRGGRYLEAIQITKGREKFGRVYAQKPSSQNTPGGACNASTNGATIYSGTYDANGNCCAPRPGGKICINCDNEANTCSDGTTQPLLQPRTVAFLHQGWVFSL